MSMSVVVYSEDSCRRPYLTQYAFNDSNDSYSKISDDCAFTQADVIGNTVYLIFRYTGFVYTIPILLFSYYMIARKLKSIYRNNGNSYKKAFSGHTGKDESLLMLINVNIGMFVQLLWSIDPDFVGDFYGQIITALIKRVPHLVFFQGGLLYLYTFQRMLNDMYSRSSKIEKIVCISSEIVFIAFMIVDTILEIVTKDYSPYPRLLWSTFYLVFIIWMIVYGVQASIRFYKTSKDLKVINRYDSTKPILLKLLFVVALLTIVGSAFFLPIVANSWVHVLRPDLYAFGEISRMSEEDIRMFFIYYVAFLYGVSILIVSVFYSTFLCSCTFAGERRSRTFSVN